MPDTITALMTNRLQALHRGTTGIKYAPDLAKYPTSLNTASLPAVLTWVGPGNFSHKGGGWRWDVRTALVLLYVEPLGQNDIPSNAARAVALADALRERYITTAQIPLAYPGDNPGGYQITLESSPDGATHSDGGIEPNLSFGGAAYYGVRFRLNVTLQWAP